MHALSPAGIKPRLEIFARTLARARRVPFPHITALVAGADRPGTFSVLTFLRSEGLLAGLTTGSPDRPTAPRETAWLGVGLRAD